MLTALDGEDRYFFVHVDAKVDLLTFTPPRRVKNIKFTDNRYYVQWGGFNQVRYQMELLRECLSSDITFDRVFILTGQDYPLGSNRQIEKELSENTDKEYIKGLDITSITKPAKIRKKLVIYHIFRDLKIPYKLKKFFRLAVVY